MYATCRWTARQRAHTYGFAFFFSSRIKRFYFHFILSREEFCYFASLCSGSQTLTHILHLLLSFWFYSLSLSVSPVGRSTKVGRLLAFGRQQSSKDASSVVTPKIRGERCSRLSLVGPRHRVGPVPTKNGAKRALPKGYSLPSDNPFLERFPFHPLVSISRFLSIRFVDNASFSGRNGKERKFESHWSPRGLRHCPPVGPF